MLKKIPIHKEQIFILLIICAVTAIAVLYHTGTFTDYQQDSVLYDENLLTYSADWSVTVNDQAESETVDLPDYICAGPMIPYRFKINCPPHLRRDLSCFSQCQFICEGIC